MAELTRAEHKARFMKKHTRRAVLFSILYFCLFGSRGSNVWRL